MKLFFYICSFILSLRYKVYLEGKEHLNQDTNFIILPNHPGLIDPQIVFSTLGKYIHISPVMTETYYKIPVITYIFRALGAISVPDLQRNSGDTKDIEHVYTSIIEGLQNKKNIILYPAGQIYSQGYESIIGKKAAYTVVKSLPKNTRILGIRTRGVWGSMWSKAYTGKGPNFISCVKKGVLYLLANALFFSPRRYISLEIVDITDTLIHDGQLIDTDLNIFNKKLQDFYNTPGKEEIEYKKHFFYYNDVKKKIAPKTIDGSIESEGISHTIDIQEIPEEIQSTVYQKIQSIKETTTPIHSKQKLINDLFFDSLDLAELKNFVSSRYSEASNPPITSLKSVMDILVMAIGKSQDKEVLKECIWIDEKKPQTAKDILGKYIKGKNLSRTTLLEIMKKNLSSEKKSSATYDSSFGLQSKNDLILKSYIVKDIISSQEDEYIGIMLPSISSTSILILATYLANKVPVMLNWTSGKIPFDHCINFSKTKKILTSKAFFDKIDTSGMNEHNDKFIFLEDVLKNVSLVKKIKALIFSKLFIIPKFKNPHAAILFTSGSEGLPKAIALTHENILEVLIGSLHHISVTNTTRLISFLPPFHSFGFVINTMLPLLVGIKTVHYPNPNDAKNIVQLIKHTGADFITATPTFLKIILENAKIDELSTIKCAVVGAEKCPKNIFETFGKFCPKGVILEGYGITECSPVISINPLNLQKQGSVGKAISGLDIKILSINDNSYVESGKEGMIYVSGPSVFNGYLDTSIENPFIDINDKKYYKTGDLGYLDEDGYLYITGRLKRFIKIAGEMISLPFIEGILNEKYGTDIAVEAIENNGLAKIVFFGLNNVLIEEINSYLREKGVNNLIKISEIQKLEKLPVLGTGKIDYKELKKMIHF